MFQILDINGSKICCDTNPCMWTSEYYKYCVHLLIAAAQLVPRPVNIILGPIDCDFKNINKTLRLDIQSEHTLVQLGGRDVGDIVYGDVDLMDGTGKYLIRVPNFEYYSYRDATIEYSLPNIANMRTHDKFADYLKTACYIAPMIYFTPDFSEKPRTDTITMFSNNPCERRAEFSAKVKGVKNIQGVFDRSDLKQVYNSSRIMVNVHQTDHHHTFEELRVLPALCNGVVIVSEDVPLKETIPYADSIVWSSYDNLAATVEDVQRNYKFYWDRIFTDELETQMSRLNRDNIENITKLIHQIS